MKKTYTTLLSISTGMAFTFSLDKLNTDRFHTEKELRAFETRAGGPHGTNDLFPGSGVCGGCHGHDPNNLAMVTPWGEDVNIYDGWAGTMMANSAKDPFWRAKVSHEILVNPGEQLNIENACTSCHAPLGHFNAFHNGAANYPMAAVLTDSLALDGVSCGACHQQKDSLIGKRFSGELIYDTTKTVYGPYPAPFAGPMQSFIGFNVKQGAHITKSGLCAGCHTLLTDVHDLSGTPTGDKFVEQATYHEWLNSIYNDEVFVSTGKSCQSCHLPRIDKNIIIAANYSFLAPRRPFGQHYLVGGNTFMLDLIKNNRAALGVTAEPQHFDTAIVRSKRLMQDSAVILELNLVNRTTDTAFYDLKITNKAGHKFPSGYPSRRAFVEFILLNETGDTIFKNGVMNSAHQLVGQDATYEPHHDVIKNENDVQIYELVAGDVNGDVTTVLERAYSALKDNRLVPIGFSTTHMSYDTTLIAGVGANDVDFNLDGVTEGTGADIIHFHVPLNGYTDDLNVSARFYYQAVPHKWLDEMFTFTSPEITSFKTMFNAANHNPLLVAQIRDGDYFASVQQKPQIMPVKLYPNPSATGVFRVKSETKVDEITVFSIQGQQVLQVENTSMFTLQRRGTYIVHVRCGQHTFTEKIIYH